MNTSTAQATPVPKQGASFELAVQDAEAWMRQSTQMLLVAKHLVGHVRPPRPASADSVAFAVGSLKVALLSLALAVENALKAVKAARRQIRISGGRIVKSSLGGGPTGHDLIILANEVLLPLSKDESALLRRLTKVALWAGRYQQPLSEDWFLENQRSDARSITQPNDLTSAEAIVQAAQRLVLEAQLHAA